MPRTVASIILSNIFIVWLISFIPLQLPQHCVFFLSCRLEQTHSFSILLASVSPTNSLLSSLVRNFIPISSIHFQTFTGNSSGPTTLPFSCFSVHSSLLYSIYLFVNHFCFLCPRLSIIFFVHQFLKVATPSITLTLPLNLPSHYHIHPS